jgi:hypothetical protein
MNILESGSREWNEAQIVEILSPENRWFAGQEFGHEPSDNECTDHYARCGGAAHFSETHKMS